MFTRICDTALARPALCRAGGFIALCLVLAGCLPDAASTTGSGTTPVQAIRVSGNGVIVTGPQGYCIDPRSARSSVRERPAGSFVMLGSCATLYGSGSGPVRPAVLTALVSPPSDPPLVPSVAALEQFFRSDAGRAALAHDGRAGSVTLLAVEARAPILFLKVSDTSTDRPDALSAQSWRAIFPMRDRLVALSVAAHGDLPLSDADMRRTLDRFAAALRAANPETGAAGGA